MKNKKLYILIVLFIIIVIFIVNFFSSIFGWYGYEKWKYRRDTYGDIQESKSRNVFIKELDFISNHDNIKGFKVYIEKGYWYGKKNMNQTMFNFSNYPYQVSFNGIGENRYLRISNINKFDSITNEQFQRPNIYLAKPKLNDTIILSIMSFKTRDSVGYIKVW